MHSSDEGYHGILHKSPEKYEQQLQFNSVLVWMLGFTILIEVIGRAIGWF